MEKNMIIMTILYYSKENIKTIKKMEKEKNMTMVI